MQTTAITDRDRGTRTRRSVGDAAKPRARRINDASATLGIGRSTLYKMAAAGKIRLVKIGNRTVVPESEIDRLLGEAV